MNDQYVRELRRHLHCFRKTQNRLLEHFTAYQRSSIEDTPDYDQMVTMFGPPEEMAGTLMEEVTSGERSAYRRNKVILKIAAIVLAVNVVICCVYFMFIKETTVLEVETYTYYGNPYEATYESGCPE